VRFSVRHYWTVWVFCTVLSRLADAAYEPEKLGDSSRRWAISVNSYGYYDDNINTTTTDRQSGFQNFTVIGLTANIPGDRTFFRMNSDYGVTYSPGRDTGEIEQSVVFNGLLSHTFTPRLVVNLNDTVRYALEPSITDIISGRSTQLQQSGNYLENNTGASINYDLSRRWTMSLSGGWDLLRYDSSIQASNNDRNVYSGGVNLSYGLTPQTFVGAGYRYSVSDYTTSGSNDFKNSTSHTLYGTFSHAFNPRLSISVDAGGQVAEFSNGNRNTSPYGNLALNYNVSQDLVASLGYRYGITLNQQDVFRSTDTGTLFGQLNYRFTPKLSATGSGLFSHSTYQNPDPAAFAPGTPIPKGEDAFQVRLSLNYMFNRWSSASIDYTYEDVNADLAGNSFTRNRIGVGVRLTY
jgi:hypothetical protein